jgi:hypothetical protein
MVEGLFGWVLGVIAVLRLMGVVNILFRLYSCARFWYEWDPFRAFLGFLSVFCGVSLRGAYDPPSPLMRFFCCVDA